LKNFMDKSSLPQKVIKNLDDFAGRLKAIYQEGLLSVILYGSCASGEFKPGFSNINLLIVLQDTSLASLVRSKGLFVKSAFRNLNCLFMSPDLIANSTDVFPIEFLDMKENYIVIYGKDLLLDLSIDLRNLRFQCEQELKAKSINIKRAFLLNRDKAALQSLLIKSFNSFLHVSRNLIRLKGRSPAYRKEEVLNELAREFKIDAGELNKILGLKDKKAALNYRETEALLFEFVKSLEAVTRAVDEF
jgi:hypothetical protein